MRDASLVPPGAAPAPPLLGGMGDASLLAPQGDLLAPPLVDKAVHANKDAPQDTLVSVNQLAPVDGVAPQDALLSANEATHVDGVATQHNLGSPSPINNSPDLIPNNQFDLGDQVEDEVTTSKSGS
jgi:hypothetical protein